jgi:3-deoxy-D-manno-octulosonic-acid transferase
LKKFFAPLLEEIDLLLMSSEVDAERIRVMGAPQERVKVTGNTKFDAALGEIPEGAEREMRALLDIGQEEPVLVAGSTHPGENEVVLAAYEKLLKRFSNLILIIVPRHVEKTPQILSLLRDRGMDAPFLRSSSDNGERRNGRRVVVVDRTGELFRVFSLATVVFVGGSLVPKGGQNILEPAAWGKVVLFGPSMEDFREARDTLMRCGAGIEVHGANDLTQRAATLLADPTTTDDLGNSGRRAVLAHKGSAVRNAELLEALMSRLTSANPPR